MPTPKTGRRLFAFLRAINVGGRNVAMAELRRIFEGLGFTAVETFIASGNVVFVSDRKSVSALEPIIENALQKNLGYEVKTFLRSDAELAAIAGCEPFPAARIATALSFNVGFLAQPPDVAARKAIMGFASDVDEFQVEGREVYWLCRARQSDSKFNNVRFEKVIGTRATWRGMNTVKRLAAKYLSP